MGFERGDSERRYAGLKVTCVMVRPSPPTLPKSVSFAAANKTTNKCKCVSQQNL